MRKLVVAASLLVFLSLVPVGAEQNGTLTIEIDPPRARVGQQVGFYLRHEDPDPLTFVHEREIDYGDGGSAYFGAYYASCTGSVAAVSDATFNAIPRAARGALGLYHFTHVYERPGTFQVQAKVGAARDFCPLVQESNEADAVAELTVLP